MATPNQPNKSTTISQQSTSINPIQFISLISRNDKPLYIQSFNIGDEEDDGTNMNPINADKFLKYNFLSHMALDIFTSPSSLSLREQQQQQQQQDKNHQNGDNQISIILLFIQDQIMVYGYETNNGLKIVIGLDQTINSTIITNNNEEFLTKLRKLFLDIQKCYLRTIFNPLNQIYTTLETGIGKTVDNDNDYDNDYDDENILQSPTFDRNIKKLVNSYNI